MKVTEKADPWAAIRSKDMAGNIGGPHAAEIVVAYGSWSVRKFSKRSEAQAAYDALPYYHASVLFKKDSLGWWSVAATYG